MNAVLIEFPHDVYMNSHSNDYTKHSVNSNKHIQEIAHSGLFDAFSSLTCRVFAQIINLAG